MSFANALQTGLYAAIAGRDLVLLDTAAGHYDLIAGVAEHLSVSPNGRALVVSDRTLREALRQDGILGHGDPTAGPILPVLPISTALASDLPSAWIDQLVVLAAWGEMVVHFYGRDLPALINRARSKCVQGPVEDYHRLKARRLARAFYRVSPWIPFQGDCVFRAYMLLRLLQGHGIPGAQWVFAVATWPFYAHCWVQLENESLSDWSEPLGRLCPILAV